MGRWSKHLKFIAMVMGLAAIGAAIIEQQLNMATAAAKGAQNSDAIAAFLAQITVYLSLIGFVIQMTLTSRIHRVLGIGFALMVLPVSLGTSAVIMLFNSGLWAPAQPHHGHVAALHRRQDVARSAVPAAAIGAEVRAKPFIDVTVDRLAKGRRRLDDPC